MESANRQNALAETEWQFVNATMVQAKTHVPGAVTAGRKLPLADRLRQFVKFCLVGGSGVAVDMSVLYLLADPKTLALNLAFSKVCAAEVALVNNFLWNEFWTFRSSGSGAGILPVFSSDKPSHARQAGSLSHSPRLRRFLFFNAICGIGILFAVLLLHLFHTLLGWNVYLSNLLTIGLVTLWNFGMNARFNWTRGVPCVSRSDGPGARDSGCNLDGTQTRRSTASSLGKLPTACIVGGLLFSLSLRSNAANLDLVEAVRDFLLNPPVISEARFVIYREGAAPDWYVCKRQANAAFVRWCLNSNEFNNLELPAQNRVVGFYEDYHWSFHRGSLTEWRDTGRMEESNNVVKRAFDSYSTALHLVTSLGISWATLASLTFSNDAFSFAIKDGVVSGNLYFEHGKLIAAEALYPVGPARPAPVIRRTEYRYATEFPDFPFLPSNWVLYVKRPGKDVKWIKLEECAITSMIGSDAALPSKAFSPEAAGILAPDRVFWVQGTNVAYYDPLTATNRTMRSLNDPLAVKHRKKSSRFLYGVLAMLLVLPLGAVVWRSLASKYVKAPPKK